MFKKNQNWHKYTVITLLESFMKLNRDFWLCKSFSRKDPFHTRPSSIAWRSSLHSPCSGFQCRTTLQPEVQMRHKDTQSWTILCVWASLGAVTYACHTTPLHFTARTFLQRSTCPCVEETAGSNMQEASLMPQSMGFDYNTWQGK